MTYVLGCTLDICAAAQHDEVGNQNRLFPFGLRAIEVLIDPL